jgi:uncharacterized protein YjbJ (UPF0337 family)
MKQGTKDELEGKLHEAKGKVKEEDRPGDQQSGHGDGWPR